jgi:hypothetical protein
MSVFARHRRGPRRLAHLAATALVAGVLPVALPVALASPGPAGDVPHLDPAALARGDNPGVVYLVRNTIRDGDLRVPATERGQHDAIWVVDGGYLLRDLDVGRPGWTKVTYVSRTGERRPVARTHAWIDVQVSPTGRTVATQVMFPVGIATRLDVSRARSGRLVAHRHLEHAQLAAVTDSKVLIGRRARWHDPATVWWNFERGSWRRVYDEAAIGADVRNDRVVFDNNPAGEFCTRVAVLSRPGRTLWRTCRIYPHQWSPDGTRAIATYSYFDAAGTARWWVIDGRTAARQAKVAGRLDWDAVWEDDQHFLTAAQSDAGKSAIVRCDIDGDCERASPIWDVPVPPDPSLYYASPPAVLARP